MKPRTIVAAGIAALALAGSAVGVASATTTSSNPSYCVTRGSGPGAAGNYLLYNWDHTACPPNTYGHTITGAQGPAGPRGPAGPSSAGPSGLDAIIVPKNGSTSFVQVACPSSHPYLIGGGGAIIGTGALLGSFPGVTSGSVVWVVHADGLGLTSSVHAYAICSK